MIFTRKIGQLFRGKTTPFQLYSACFIGAAIGLIPDFAIAPGLIVFWLLLLLVLNANLFLAGAVGLLSKAILIVAMPICFAIGRFLLEGPTEVFFKSLANAPVTAYFGFDYYAVVGGQVLALILAWPSALLCNRSIKKYRLKMKSLEGQPNKLNQYSSKSWVRILKFIFLGSGKGKKSYDELLSKRWGNPIRIWGAALSLTLVVILYVFVNKMSDPIIASVLKKNLEQANGATVDLESAHFDLKGGRLELNGFAMADPDNLETNLFSSSRVVADISSSDILKKRFSVDNLVFENSLTGTKRTDKGVIVGKPTNKKKKDPMVELPEYESLDELIKDAEVWKERLSQVKRWLQAMGDDGADGEEKQTFEESLKSRIRSLGYAYVNKKDSIEGSPTLWVRNMVAKQINTHYIDGATLDLVATDLSSHPSLVEKNPRIQLNASDGSFDADIAFGSAAGRANNLLKMNVKGLNVDEVTSDIKVEDQSIFKGGTMDIEITGDLNAMNSDLVISTKLLNSKLFVGGSSVDANNLQIPLYFKGPLDNPKIKVDSKALKGAFAKAGKDELLKQASEKLGIEIPEGKEGDTLEDTAKNLFDGFLKKNLKDK